MSIATATTATLPSPSCLAGQRTVFTVTPPTKSTPSSKPTKSTSKKTTPQPVRKPVPWGSREKLEGTRQEFMKKYGSKLHELRKWQIKLLKMPIPANAEKDVLDSYYKGIKCAVEQFNGLRPAPVKATQRSRFTPSTPVVASHAPMFERKIPAPVVKTDSKGKKGGNKPSNKK